MVINTGSRTDIPAYFSEWFYNRIKEGYVLTRNPYYKEQVIRYQLSPDVVDILCFCTKNPQPMLPRLEELNAFRQFWFVTITPYGKEIEPYVPDKGVVMESFQRLSKIVGINCIGWRYDPIFISDRYTVEFHVQAFEKMANRLQGYVDNCVISFIDLYEKTKRNFPGVRQVTRSEREQIGQAFVEIGRRYGITIRSCCEGTELQPYGVDTTGCMTKEVLERAVGASLIVPKSKKGAREGCDCLLGNDIGMYHTCGHGCLYCYANYDRATVKQNLKLHDPQSPFLIGGFRDGDQIKEARQESYYDGQMTLPFDHL
ncbi:hypothetical protein lbkm_1399 [Lachnospiraceae bacterium KM106-2]|nr:hypothetical protein lbkm_1399 [Lachnospiraceae bacterium KM106-2]